VQGEAECVETQGDDAMKLAKSRYYVGPNGLCIRACGVELRVIGFNELFLESENGKKLFITPIHEFVTDNEEDKP
jgi:hypothetical protein